MAKYRVTVYYGGSFSTTVEADSYREAEDKAIEEMPSYCDYEIDEVEARKIEE